MTTINGPKGTHEAFITGSGFANKTPSGGDTLKPLTQSDIKIGSGGRIEFSAQSGPKRLSDMKVEVGEGKNKPADTRSGREKFVDFFKSIGNSLKEGIADIGKSIERHQAKRHEARAEARLDLKMADVKLSGHTPLDSIIKVNDDLGPKAGGKAIDKFVDGKLVSVRVSLEKEIKANGGKHDDRKEARLTFQSMVKSLTNELATSPTPQAAVEKLEQIKSIVNDFKPDHPNAKNREMFAKALGEVESMLSSPDVAEHWDEIRADTLIEIKGGNVTEPVNNIVQLHKSGGPIASGKMAEKLFAEFSKVDEIEQKKINEGAKPVSVEAKITDRMLGELAKIETFDEAKTICKAFREAVESWPEDGPGASNRDVFLKALDNIETKATSLDEAVKDCKIKFKAEFANQVTNPNTFFRGTTTTGSVLQGIIRNDSAPMVEKMKSTFSDLIANISDHPLYDLAKEEPTISKKDNSKQWKLDPNTGVPARQALALDLATQWLQQVMGSTPEEHQQFADLMGDATKEMFKLMSQTVKQEPNLTPTQKDKAELTLNSNNLILRAAGKITTDMSLGFDKSKGGTSFEGDLLRSIQAILTSAAGNVMTVGKDGTEYRALPRYNLLVGNISANLKDVIDNRIGGDEVDLR